VTSIRKTVSNNQGSTDGDLFKRVPRPIQGVVERGIVYRCPLFHLKSLIGTTLNRPNGLIEPSQLRSAQSPTTSGEIIPQLVSDKTGHEPGETVIRLGDSIKELVKHVFSGT